MKRTFLRILPVAAALLLATSCSKDSDNDTSIATTPGNNLPAQEQVVEQPKSQTIPFSITVGKDTETLSKATLQDGTTKTQIFETGDVLVLKNGDTEVATLTLAEGDGQTTATFSGTLATDGLTSGTTEISVTLKNDGNGNAGTALTAPQPASTLAEAFQKYGYWTSSFTYTEGETPTISLTQNTAFLNINLPFQGAKIDVTIGGGDATPIYVSSKQAVAIPNGSKIKSTTLGIDETTIDVLSGSKKVVYNIRSTETKKRKLPTDCIAGVFSVAADKQIFFSKGNLQATTSDLGGNWTWNFAANQYSCIGNAAANTSIDGNGTVSENGTVDLFGWVGASNTTWTGGAMYGISSSTEKESASTYGNVSPETLKSDWGKVFGESSLWATLTTDEWQYIFNTRANASSLYGHGQIDGVTGMIILPDGWAAPEGTSFTPGNSDWTNTYAAEQWTAMESSGAVFLPAAGGREGFSVSGTGTHGCYWTSSDNDGHVYLACYVQFYSNGLVTLGFADRNNGFSVRLVRSL